MYFYCLMSPGQRDQLEELFKIFNQDSSKDKILYEVSFSQHRLKVFERPSRKDTYCVDRKVLKNLQDTWLAEQVIKNAFGSRTVELVPKVEKWP